MNERTATFLKMRYRDFRTAVLNNRAILLLLLTCLTLGIALNNSAVYAQSTGAIKQLTFFSTPAQETWQPPSLTADGRFLYFVSSRNLAGANPSLSPQIFRLELSSGTTTQISSFNDGAYTGQLQVAGNGSRLVFVRAVSNWSTFVMNSDGTGLLQVSHTPGWCTRSPLITFDGNKVLYVANETDTNPSFDIYVVNAEATGRQKVYSGNEMGFLLLSGDGSKIIMETNSYPLHRYLMKSDGSGLTDVLYDEQGAKYGITLSFDGTYSLFVSSHDYGENPAHNQNLFRMKNDGSDIVQITYAPDFPCEGGLYCVPFSNLLSMDGQRVVYGQNWRLNSQGGSSLTLVRRNADGTNALNLLDLPQTDFGGSLLAINQDASVVVFASQDDYTGQNPNHNREFFAYIDQSGTPSTKSSLTITNITAKDAETGEYPPTSGKPAKIEITIKNIGSVPTNGTALNAGIFSIDVKGEDCDLISGNWVNNEKLIQGEFHTGETLIGLAPGQETTKTYDYTFYNACFTDRLRVILVASQTMQYEIPYFKPFPNPDAFLNCWLEMSTLVAFPILESIGIMDGDMRVLLEGIKLKSLDEYKIIQSLHEGNFKAFGNALFTYCADSAKLILKVSGIKLASTVISSIQAGINEWNHRGCGETLPHVFSTFTDIITGICEASYNSVYKLRGWILGSPADLEVIDALSNSIYVSKIGEESNSISDSVGFIINDGSADPIKSVLTTSEGPFVINLYGTSTGTAEIDIIQPRTDGNLIKINYAGIPLTPLTFATMTISDETFTYRLLIDSDGNGSFEKIRAPSSLGFINHSVVIYSTLGAGKLKPLDMDAFKFRGEKGEQITVRLTANASESYYGQNVALTIIGPRMFKREVNSGLPTEITATLPMSGEYQILVGNVIVKRERFNGHYCLILESSANSYQTLQATESVE